MNETNLSSHFYELIRRTSTELPADVVAALEKARDNEDENSSARSTFNHMLDNVKSAVTHQAPLCQDTGTIIFYIDYGPEYNERSIRAAVREAVAKATSNSLLRPNTTDPVTGKNPGNNLGNDSLPYIHFKPRDEEGLSARLMLKGGGCENVSTQYSLPSTKLGAGRDMAGIKKCIVDSVVQAQGLGCAPGTIGVGLGGDRMISSIVAKEQLFRKLDDKNPDEALAAVEEELHEKLNLLEIGPMGFGGKTTVLGVKIGQTMRHPASFFVSIAYMCWSFRRKNLEIKNGEPNIFD